MSVLWGKKHSGTVQQGVSAAKSHLDKLSGAQNETNTSSSQASCRNNKAQWWLPIRQIISLVAKINRQPHINNAIHATVSSGLRSKPHILPQAKKSSMKHHLTYTFTNLQKHMRPYSGPNLNQSYTCKRAFICE
jgi:hypothetical protein